MANDGTKYNKLQRLIVIARLLSTETGPKLLQEIQDADFNTAKKLIRRVMQEQFDLDPSKLTRFLTVIGDGLEALNVSRLYRPERLRDGIPLDKGSSLPTSGKVPSSLFDKLPLEILQQIMTTMDLQSLVGLRSQNSLLRRDVGDLPQFQLIQRHASIALRAILATNIGAFYTVKEICAVLQDEACSKCGASGFCLYLLTMYRLCERCFNRSKQPVPLNYAIKQFCITKPVIKDNCLPIVKTISSGKRWRYDDALTKGSLSYDFVDVDMVKSLAIKFHGSEEALERAQDKRLDDWVEKVQSWCERPEDQQSKRPPPRPAHLVRLSSTWHPLSIQHTVVVGLPIVTKCHVTGEHRVESGFKCQASISYHYQRGYGTFTSSGLLEHFLSCADAQRKYILEFHGLNSAQEREDSGII